MKAERDLQKGGKNDWNKIQGGKKLSKRKGKGSK